MRRWRAALTALVTSALVVPLTGLTTSTSSTSISSSVEMEEFQIEVGPEPDGSSVTLDVSVLTAADAGAGTESRPAVVLAHGFGGDKSSTREQATQLVEDGYVVLTYSARGFGDSGGRIHLDALDYEVADASRMLDLLAERDDVVQDADGDPHVGVAGGSYGGALSLLLAGSDPRVDVVAASHTWNDLGTALAPQAAVGEAGSVLKTQWAALFFSIGRGLGSGVPDDVCGRLDPTVCETYVEALEQRRLTPQMLDQVAESNPSGVLGDVTAPTLLIQGQSDSLFPLSEADATARTLAAADVPLEVYWSPGGHDDPQAASDEENDRVRAWFDQHLRPDPEATPTLTGEFSYTVAESDSLRQAPGYPGTGGGADPASIEVPLSGAAQTIFSPPGGEPAAMTSLPGVGSLAELGQMSQGTGQPSEGEADPSQLGNLSIIPGQSARFTSEPLAEPLRQVGPPRVGLEVASTTTDATLFTALYDVAPDGSATLPEQLVAPVRLENLRPGQPRTVDVRLPTVVRDIPAGHRLQLVVATTNQAFATPDEARSVTVELSETSGVAVPTLPAATAVPADPGLSSTTWLVVGITVLALLLAGAGGWSLRRRFHRTHLGGHEQGEGPYPEDAPTVQVRGLAKSYGQHTVVDQISFDAYRGQVVGLLGPNGAGKTTTLRMLMGLVRPNDGHVQVLGQQVSPGAPVLAEVGALIEGPGFLPHRTGRQNLQMYWEAAGGRPAEAGFDDALRIAGLGEATDRLVATYSTGMKQRLGIAQAMLGMPAVLVLDEPINGLDPPQIRQMREVIRNYAATGRTVVVSSHLLGEMEQTCSDVVVLHHGRLITAGPVTELVPEGSGWRMCSST